MWSVHVSKTFLVELFLMNHQIGFRMRFLRINQCVALVHYIVHSSSAVVALIHNVIKSFLKFYFCSFHVIVCKDGFKQKVLLCSSDSQTLVQNHYPQTFVVFI